MSGIFYEKNPLHNDPSVNITFDEALSMSLEDFDKWVLSIRYKFIEVWDNEGCPPRDAKNKDQIIREWNKLENLDVVSRFTKSDELTPHIQNDVIHNTLYTGSEVNQFFPNMMKTVMCYGKKLAGHSMYDVFKQDRYKKMMIGRHRRHIRQDSFYHYSSFVKKDKAETASQWLDEWLTNPTPEYDFWICEVKNKGSSSGYYAPTDILYMNSLELESFKGQGLTRINLANVNLNNLNPNSAYGIRVFAKGKRIFPEAYRGYKVGYESIPTNFPPTTAKYLYERFTTPRTDPIVIYDPSAGWGGRILGAMAVNSNRKIHYIGTDPNPDNVDVLGISKYAYVADFYNNETNRNSSLFGNSKNTYDIFQDGSEVIHTNPKFQRYKGNVDLVFTSPPYFNRELYCKDPNQSAVKFGSDYASWRDGYLKPTLNTCVDWLKSGGYLLWNVADIFSTDKSFVPIEEDSVNYILSLGMKQEQTLKMALQPMPGANRINGGIPTCKNYCKVNGRYMKYEPIFVFRKNP